ncbi:MAG: heterodisulfide reductase-related iron-sulfur binding cluster [Thermoanaerobaculia bacterium]
MTEATREIGWNIRHAWLMYVLLAPALGVAAWGLVRRVARWRLARPGLRLDRPWARLALVLRHVVLQQRLARAPYAGVMHLAIFAAFLVLTVATVVVMLDYDLGTRLMRGAFYLWFQSLAVDVFGVAMLAGLGMALFRRLGRRSPELVRSREATIVLALLLAIVVTGFLLEGWRIALTADPWASWSPAGRLVAAASSASLSVPAMRAAHEGTWWLHLVLVLGLLAWAPFGRLLHVVTAPLAVFFGNLDGHAQAVGALNLEGDERFGARELADLSVKDLVDLDACTECGRCTAACPAARAGKALSPRDLILQLRDQMHSCAKPGAGADGKAQPFTAAGTAASVEAVWQCTTCAACLEACPVLVEQMPKLVEARRFLVMEEAEMPDGIAAALASLEKRGHPFPGTAFSRVDWAAGLDVPVLSELGSAEKIDVLLWVGCAGALVERNHAAVRALASLLARAGVRFAILGREERCTGDLARRAGNELLFQRQARANLALFARYGVRRIVTACPHCLTALRDDYRALGGELEVVPHGELLAELLREGRLVVRTPLARVATFHDPCYLGRYAGGIDDPRELLAAATGCVPREMAESRRTALCCGGGGGMSFVEEPAAQRVNRLRARQAVATGADVVGAACPFCLPMLEDGLTAVAQGNRPRVADVAELLWEAVRGDGTADGETPPLERPAT